MIEENNLKVSNADRRTSYRLVLVIAVLIALFFIGIWKISDFLKGEYRPVDQGGASVKGNINNVPAGTALTVEGTSNAVSEAIAARNARDQETAAASGVGQIDRLYDGTETIEQLEVLQIKGILKELEGIKDRQTDFQEQLINMQYNSNGNTRDQQADIDRYTGLDGVEYLSQDYRLREKEGMSSLWEKVASAREVSLTDSISAFNAGGGRSNQQIAAVSNIGNNGTFIRKNGIRTVGSTGGVTTGNSTFGGSPEFAGNPIGANQSTGRNASYEAIPVTGLQEIGQLDLKLNSNIGGPVQATILSGENQGTLLYANAFDVDREYITINFTRFCLPKDRVPFGTQTCGTINAYAVDLGESVAAIRGKYKGNYAIRLLGATGAAFVAGLGRAYSTNLSPGQLVTTNSVISIPREQISREEAANASLLEVGTSLAETIRDITQREPTTSAKVNKNIGILILSPGLIQPRSSTTQVLNFRPQSETEQRSLNQ